MKPIDCEAILGYADDHSSRKMLHRIFASREEVASRNEFPKDDSYFTIRLNGLELNLKFSNSFSAIETFYEIFIKNGHCKVPEFMPENARTVLDIGANQGFYALRVAQANPSCRISCFEPNPFEFESLRRNLSSNKMADKIEAWNLALAAKPGDIYMEVIPQIGAIGGPSLKSPARKWIKDEFIRRISVKAIALDEGLQISGFEHVDILKLDVEGLELEILGSFHSFAAVERIVVEYHFAAGRNGLMAMMVRNGFSLVFEDTEPGDYYGDLYFEKRAC